MVDQELLHRLQNCTEQQKRPIVVPLLLVIPEKQDHQVLVQQGPYSSVDKDGKLVDRIRAWQDHLLATNQSLSDQANFKVIQMDMDRLPAILDQVQAIILEKITLEMA